ncbi:hypothetical protein HPB49_021865 [Dermacentor silvarum]|uniref:Uncharacterized protein n=1 Tax=Dermacentor silvarum TaxID=543639 RepID=A0ACB8DRF0_DERSI|nr:hypothetical protein HPB49_021865 [Dermacentor silvarum]
MLSHPSEDRGGARNGEAMENTSRDDESCEGEQPPSPPTNGEVAKEEVGDDAEHVNSALNQTSKEKSGQDAEGDNDLKPQNRYRVPAGTRFYRVKAKPWDKEAAVRREQQRRSSLRSLTQSSFITASSAAEEVAPPPPAQSEAASAGEPYPQPLDS